ncbi:MAG: gamma carbonic anhydrase family protein [Alphaproteobacteria bacterium]|jgi:carbonic anhydrase/acetyltransferase-like protein (isoleucine patch superfamily)|nr:gamma carbonic anhydrase family protein [Alphaproteobacteria bacterium]MDP6567614.1 gamma carbonic anhydrase family protein [Alphaproteobacteria bacterium]MDP6814928.1 gamma carbonic anhydrase family protein [Alphaproteobacteria bacterium]
MSLGHILPFEERQPKLDPRAFVAPGAYVIGEVEMGALASVWYNCVVRGDEEPIHIGRRTNLQDGTIVHTSAGIADTWIGDEVLVGHMCLLHGCRLEDRAFVGMGSTVLDHAVIESGAMLAAGALLTPGKRIPSGQLWGGSPAKYMRDLRPEELKTHAHMVEEYVQLALKHTATLA